MALIELSGVTKTFGEIKALDNVSLEINSGEVFGFLGPNGAGKSTTIRCMMGFIFPDFGEIKIDGSNVDRTTAESRRNIGFVSSDLQLNEKWSGVEHINFVMKSRRIKSYPDALVERLGFHGEKKVKQLSTGNRQKLALILALLAKPKLLILDEPSKGLDPLLQETMYELLVEFKENGGCVFFSSHNLTEVERISDRIGIIRQGRIVANETLDTLQSKHIHIVKILTSDGKDHSLDFTKLGQVEQDNNGILTVRVEGDLNPLLKQISQYEIADISIEHASLEDMFLHYYEDEK